jgi:hypothetical protein
VTRYIGLTYELIEMVSAVLETWERRSGWPDVEERRERAVAKREGRHLEHCLDHWGRRVSVVGLRGWRAYKRV